MKVEMDMPELPDGWEYTGEVRNVLDGEHYYSGSGIVKWDMGWSQTHSKYPIVRRKPFRIEVGKWYVTRDGRRVFRIEKNDFYAWKQDGSYLYAVGEYSWDLVREVKVTTLEGEVL